LKYQILIKLIV